MEEYQKAWSFFQYKNCQIKKIYLFLLYCQHKNNNGGYFDQRRNPVYNPNIYNSGMENQTTAYIFYYEYLLAHVLLFALDNSPYMVQYDQDASW